MGYEELFPGMDMKWHANANKRFASPFVDVAHDRIDVDPIILSHAAVACGFTIRDFYEKPELGIHCVGYISQLYDLLPVTHWFYSLPWVRELGLTLQYKDTLPPISTGPIISEPGQVDNIHVPDVDELMKGYTLPEFIRIYEYVQKNLPMTLVPISYGFDLVGAAAELCGVENFIMWTFTEPEAAHKLVKKYTDTSVNGAIGLANRFGMAMLIVGSVLANNDIFSDEAVKEYSANYMKYYVDKAFRGGAGPQLFYHLCGNHQTDYKVFKDTLFWSPFNVIHIGYYGRDPFPSKLLKEEFGNRSTIMGSVDTKLMINPNPKIAYEQAKAQILAGRDSPKGYILGTSCETPPYTIPGNLLALVKAARDYGTYGTW
ncbi:MAG: uroporphyrinogen decarboxylase family protein [Methanomassiliicoccales archaeon]|jgi:uroporphyrinogen decarboxylase|nr:uroporphyrinogen decarboxylase family protein [Methanomassiliicoccales archaeon]